MPLNLRGVLPPITTPFDRDEVDLKGLRANTERWMKTGLVGLVALGSNGEAPQVDEDESDRVIAAVRDCMPAGRTLVAGTGRESTRASIAAARRAAALGADAMLVRTPSFFKAQMTADALVRHFTAVADASPAPVLLYNFTALTGVNLDPATVARLAEHPNVAGIKDSGTDVSQVAEYVSRSRPGFAVLVGNAPSFFAGLCVGAVGGILAAACVTPDQWVRVYELVAAGRLDEALALQRRLNALARLVTSAYGVPGLKAALDLAGYIGGDPRPPLGPVPPVAVERIREELAGIESRHTPSSA